MVHVETSGKRDIKAMFTAMSEAIGAANPPANSP
jgi:hypothetical protein